MRFTTKTHERLDEKFHNGLHVAADVRSYGRTVVRSYGRTVVRSDGHVITKISRIHRLPFFLTHGAPL